MDKHIVQVAREIVRALIDQEIEQPSSVTAIIMIRNGVSISDANQKKVAVALRRMLDLVVLHVFKEGDPMQEKNEGYKAILWDMYTGKPEFVWENLDTVEQGLKLITSVLDDSHISWKIAPDGYQVVLPDSIPGDQALGTVIRLKKLDHGYR